MRHSFQTLEAVARRCSLRKAVLRNIARLWHSCFPVNFAKFLRTPFLQNTVGRLLLEPFFLFHGCFQGFCPDFKSIFFPKQLSITARFLAYIFPFILTDAKILCTIKVTYLKIFQQDISVGG